MKSIPSIVATLLVVASGYVHGMWTGRWHSSDALAKAASSVALLPTEFADWKMVHETDVSAEEKSVAELAASVSRQYRNEVTGDVVAVLLMVGKSGPISVHPPTACYTGLGYQQLGATRNYACDVETKDNKKIRHQFQTAQFTSPKKTETVQPQVFWGWSADGVWSSPDSPRLVFVGKPALFKLYVSYEATSLIKSKEQTPAEKMLKDLLPVLSESLFAQR